MMTDEQNLTEVDALRKDWYERVFNTIEKLDGNVNALSKDLNTLKDDLKEYVKTGDEKLENKLRKKIDTLSDKIDADKKTEQTAATTGKRWLIGLVFIASLSVAGNLIGYVITTRINSHSIETISKEHKEIKDWQKEKNDRIEHGFIKSARNEKDISDIKKDIETHKNTSSHGK